MGDQRGDERGPHGEAFDWEDGRTPRTTSRRSSSASCGGVAGAWLERGWSAAGARLEALTEEERVVSYRRACRHGRMDVIRAELVCRGAQAMPAEEPARVFLGGPAEGGGP
jgi:hypothetical protein